MKADAITSGNCKLAPVSLATISIDFANVQRDYVMTTRQRTFYWPDSHHGCLCMPAVVVISICLLYTALTLLRLTNWSVINKIPYYRSLF